MATPTARQQKKEAALRELSGLHADIERTEGEAAVLRRRRNEGIFEVKKTFGDDVAISEIARAAGVGHTFATRCIRQKGQPESGSRQT